MASFESTFRNKRLVPACDAVVEEPHSRLPWRDRAKTSLSLREYREANTRFYGNNDEAVKIAQSYLPMAQVLLGALIHQLRLGGIHYGSRVIKAADNVMIRVAHSSGQNIIEVAATYSESKDDKYRILFYYTLYPKRAGYPSGYVRPMDEKNPYGQRAEYPWQMDGKDGQISVIKLKYPQAALNGPVSKNSPILSAERATEYLSGNQFCFDRFTCYSWWWSPCGDGPLAIYLLPEDVQITMYRPFLMYGVLLCYLYPGASVKPLPPLCQTFLMRDGKIIYDWQRPIVGMQIINYRTIENSAEVIKKAGVVLLYGIEVITGVMIDLTTLSEIGSSIVLFRKEDIRANDEDLLIDLAWPWRFNDDGSEVSAIVREKKQRKVGLPINVDLLVVTAKLTYSKDGVKRDSLEIKKHPRPLITTIKTKSTAIGQPANVAYPTPPSSTGYRTDPGGKTTYHVQSRGRYTGDRMRSTEIKEDYEIPFALNYVDNKLEVFKISYTRNSKQETKEFIGAYGAVIHRAFDQWVKIQGNENGNYNITVEQEYLGGAELWEGEKYEATDEYTASGVSNLFDLSYQSESHSTQSYKNYRHATPELSYTAHIVGGWGPEESRTETFSESLESDVQKSYEYEGASSITYAVRIPYINLKVESVVFYKYVEVKSHQGAYIPVMRLRQTGFGKPIPDTNPYNYHTVYNPYINMGDIATDSVSSAASSQVAVNYAGEFVMYDKDMDEEQREVSSSSSSGPASLLDTAGMFAGIVTEDKTDVIKDIAGDPTNGWVITSDTVSIAADYYRPPLIEKEPTFMALVSIPYLSKQYADFGKGPVDLEKLLPDEPSLNPIGMF